MHGFTKIYAHTEGKCKGYVTGYVSVNTIIRINISLMVLLTMILFMVRLCPLLQFFQVILIWYKNVR